MRLLIEAANTAIAVVDGVIAAPEGDFDRVVRAPQGHIRPGLINAHEHLHRNHYGRLGAPPYANAYAWAADIQSRYADCIAAGRALPRRQALLRGAWKNLLSGVTHVVHHDAWEGDFEQDFPLHVARLACGDSLGLTPGFTPPRDGHAFALHVAEGVDARAAAEISQLAAMGFVKRNLLAVHCVGADEDGIAQLRQAGAGLIWCPSSNHFLFGRSMPPALLAEGMDVLLGSDSLLTADGALLDEIRLARGALSEARLLDAVGPLAARRLGIAGPRLAIGAPADLVLLRRPLLEAGLDDVLLVIAQGKIAVIAPELLPILQPQEGQLIAFQGVSRWIAGTLTGPDGGKVKDLSAA